MTDEQKQLLLILSNTFEELAEVCENDEIFHTLMIKNSDLVPYSLNEMSAEWSAIADGIDRSTL